MSLVSYGYALGPGALANFSVDGVTVGVVDAQVAVSEDAAAVTVAVEAESVAVGVSDGSATIVVDDAPVTAAVPSPGVDVEVDC